jgi:hypothetical protein
LLRSISEYGKRFERGYGYFRPIVQEVVEKDLDCGNPKCGFAQIKCPDCCIRLLLAFFKVKVLDENAASRVRKYMIPSNG